MPNPYEEVLPDSAQSTESAEYPQIEIKRLEEQINQIIYDCYKLTKEDIEVILTPNI